MHAFFFLRDYVNWGMALVPPLSCTVVASLPATFRVTLGQHTLINVNLGGSPLSGLVGGLEKARRVLDLTR